MRKLIASAVLISSLTITTVGMSSTAYARTRTHTTTTVTSGTYPWCGTHSTPCVDTSGWGVSVKVSPTEKTKRFLNCDMDSNQSHACFTYVITNEGPLYTVKGGKATSPKRPKGVDF